MNIKEFKSILDSKRKETEYNPYEGSGRTTHCYLSHIHEGKTHYFEVRGWKLKDCILTVSVVNWTLCAGTAVLELTDGNVKDWEIVDEIP